MFWETFLKNFKHTSYTMAWGRTKIKQDILEDIDRQIQKTQKELNNAEKKGNDPQSVKLIMEECVKILERDVNIIKTRIKNM